MPSFYRYFSRNPFIIQKPCPSFAGYIDAATSMFDSCGGSGSTPSSGWGKKKDDEDDWKYAHRCAQMAHSMCKPKPRSRSFHR